MISDSNNFTKIRSILEEVINNGMKDLVPSIELLLNESMVRHEAFSS